MSGFKLIVLTLFALQFSVGSYALGASRKRINTKRLQDKYWTPKNYKTGVVQGRTFHKEGRFKLGLEMMTLLNDKYSSSEGVENYRAELNYYLTERFAIGGFYENMSLKDNTALKEMSSFNGGAFKLSHVKADSFYGASVDFVPIYSKMSWMNKKIIYFDFVISPKIGMATYNQQVRSGAGAQKTTPFVGLDLSTNIFLTKYISVNLAYRARAYQAEVVNYTSEVVEDDSKLHFNNFFTLGFNVYL